MRWKWTMLFRIGLTVVVLVAVILFYLNNVFDINSAKSRLSDLIKSNSLAFQDSFHHHHHHHHHHDDDGHHGDAIHDHHYGDGRRQDHPHQHGDDSVVGGAEQNRDVDGRQKDSPNRDAGAQHNKDSVDDAKDSQSGTVLHENGAERRDNDNGNLLGKDKAGGKLENSEDGRGENNNNAVDVDSGTGIKPIHRRVGKRLTEPSSPVIHLAVVACGDRAAEVMVMLKSAVMMTPSVPLTFHIFAETELHDFLIQQLDLWPSQVREGVEYRIYDITFPEGENTEEWKKLFKLCASQRLFLPTLLTGVDSLIYVDTDILFVSPLTKLWAFFAQFNATQLVALAPEHEDPGTGWYNRFARHPFVPPLGVNSGVMLMNLTRLRQSKWLPSLLQYYKEYRLKITWGDQDLINIYFHHFPEQLYIYECDWNYRPDHCMYMSVCKPAEHHGAFVLHGCRRVMHNDKQPAFKAVYTVFKEYRFGEDLEFVFLPKLKQKLEEVKTTPCGKVASIFYKQVEEFAAERRRIHDNENKIPEVEQGRIQGNENNVVKAGISSR